VTGKDSNMSGYRIVFEEPPAARRGQASNGSLQKLIEDLDKNHRNKWARESKARKHISYLYGLRKKYPNMRIATRKNPNGTFGVWIRMEDAPVALQHNGSKTKK